MSGLRVAGLGVGLGGTTILRGVDVEAPAGALTALVGPNGSGKSTLLRSLVGALPARGTVLLDGADLAASRARERARRLALVEQDSPTAVPLTVLDVVLLGRIPHRPRWGADSPTDVALAVAALRATGAAEVAGREFATLSGGERQRVHLARALAQAPAVLLLDEPTNHLDVGAQLEVLALARHQAEAGAAVVAALHDLNHALRFADHVVVLDAGTVIAAGIPADVLTPGLVGSLYGVRARRLDAGDHHVLLFDPPATASHSPSDAPASS